MKNGTNQKNPIQVVVSSDKTSFLITKMLSEINIISPFERNEGEYFTNFTTPNNRIYRIQELYQSIPKFSTYSMSGDNIIFDCVNKLPEAMFKDVDSGIIHFSASESDDKSIDVDPKMVFKISTSESIELPFNQNVKFKTRFLKVFPIILTNGFILSIVDSEEATIFITLNNPEKNFIGSCLRQEVINVITNLIPIWPIFDVYVGISTKIHLRKQFSIDRFKGKTPIILNLTYKFNNPSVMTAVKIADGV